MSNRVEFNITIPIAKSDRQDGWYITGIAAGTEVDRENDSLTPEAIVTLAEQVNMEMVPFRNHHQVDSITEDLGYVVKAEVLPTNQLWVEVKLDEDNPEAQYLWRKLDKGKKYGMSIKGSSIGWYYEKAGDRQVRKHKHVRMDEVSATTRPVYTPSLGTVLRKAIDEADASLAMGDTAEMSTPNTEGEVVTITPESSAPENDTAEVTKSLSPSVELVKSLLANDDFVALIKSTVAEAVSATTETATETADSVDDSTEVAKSETTEATASEDIAAIVKSAVIEVSAAFTAQLNALAERIPEVSPPGVLVKSETQQVEEVISSLKSDPRQALRVGLAARHGELDRL